MLHLECTSIMLKNLLKKTLYNKSTCMGQMAYTDVHIRKRGYEYLNKKKKGQGINHTVKRLKCWYAVNKIKNLTRLKDVNP